MQDELKLRFDEHIGEVDHLGQVSKCNNISVSYVLCAGEQVCYALSLTSYLWLF